MFVVITDTLPNDCNVREWLPKTVESLEKERIMWFTMPSTNDKGQKGKALVRYLTIEEFYSEFLMEDVKMANEYKITSKFIERWLKEHSGEIID